MSQVVNVVFALIIPAVVILFCFRIRLILSISPSSWTSAVLAFSAGAFLGRTSVVIGETLKSPPKNDETSE
jgi:hypothetical protein